MPTDTIHDLHNHRALLCAADGPPISHESDALTLVSLSYEHEATLIVLPVERLAADFFDLSTGLAGAVLQKLVNYRLGVAIMGDIRPHLERSAALRDFVRESNRGDTVLFVADLPELERRLAR